MKIERGFTNSRVARRIVLLFVLCALVPIVATAFLSYDHVRKLLLDRSYQHLAQLGESYASTLYERLSGVARLLRDATPAAGAPWPAARHLSARTELDAVAKIARDGKVTALAGTLPPFAPLTDAEWRFLARGEAALRTHANAGGPATVLLAQAIDPERIADGALIAAINPAYLWGEADALPAFTDFTVLGPDGVLLFASQGPPNALLAALDRDPPASPNGRLIYPADDGAEVASYRELFLESHFYVHGWTVVATRPESEVLAPIAAYKHSFLLATVLALLGIVLLSVSQIRRTLVPLERLIDGTRRAANKDFSVRVDVGGDDEFRELADSFNTMTARLGRQFTALSTLAEIDRTILSRPDVARVIESVLRRIRSIVPAPGASIAVADGAPGATRVFTRGAADGIDAEVLPDAPLPAAVGVAAAKPAGVWLTAGDDMPPVAAPLLRSGAAALFVVPIVWQGDAIGAIVVGATRCHAFSDDEEARVRDLADRVGVAFAAAAKDEQLYYQAHYDALTRLPNRLYFKDQLERALTRAERDRAEVAVLFVDLDYFKYVNDSVGHAAGDDVLVEAAARMRRCVRSADIVGRLGGDEFTILITDIRSGQDARIVADNVIAAMSRPFVSTQHEHFLSASIGIAVYPGDGATADDLLRNADTAMYRAKDGGRSQSVFFEERMNVAALARVRSERDLRHALEHGELYLVYQPMLSLRTGRISGAEALLRWDHPEHGALPPTRFIQLAEETGIIDPLGEWVLREACLQFRERQGDPVPLPAISVNVSARQFRQSGFAAMVARVLRETAVAPAALEIEITESLLLDATPAVERALAALSEAGTRIALDDFGTGYSSLAYLKRFPVDIVKIDRSFVKDLPADRSSAAITGAIVSMARALQKQVVAEGVATTEQAAFLRDLGCDHLQGYYLAKPLHAAELAEFLARFADDAERAGTPARAVRRAKPAIKVVRNP
ncbi:MAG: EAL domain-containing protein [Burkholderiales bacterium]|nr:EAL domain-containing protein [Burkholderiales bacterium]